MRAARPIIDNLVEAFFAGLHGPAEGLGEWAFYGAVVLIALALVQWFPTGYSKRRIGSSPLRTSFWSFMPSR